MEIKVSVAPNRKIKILFLPGSKSALIEMMTLINNLDNSKKIHYRFLLNDELKKICLNQNIALKDNIFTDGVLTTAATPGLKEYIPNYNATCWQNFEDAGSILIGKTMLHEYAIAASLWSDGYGAARNPWDQVKTTNGSSSGSAAAVAAGLSTVGIGTETGASVRRPASFCGLVSMLGTYGRISRYGVIPNSWSLDHVGIMTREVDDAQIVYEAIAGHDHKDPTSLQQDIYSNKNLTHKSNDLIGAIMWDHIEGSVEEDVLVAMKEAVQILQGAGVKIMEIQSSALDFAALTSSVMMKSEVTAAHSHALQLSPEKYSVFWQPNHNLNRGHYFISIMINDMQVHYLKVVRE